MTTKCLSIMVVVMITLFTIATVSGEVNMCPLTPDKPSTLNLDDCGTTVNFECSTAGVAKGIIGQEQYVWQTSVGTNNLGNETATLSGLDVYGYNIMGKGVIDFASKITGKSAPTKVQFVNVKGVTFSQGTLSSNENYAHALSAKADEPDLNATDCLLPFCEMVQGGTGFVITDGSAASTTTIGSSPSVIKRPVSIGYSSTVGGNTYEVAIGDGYAKESFVTLQSVGDLKSPGIQNAYTISTTFYDQFMMVHEFNYQSTHGGENSTLPTTGTVPGCPTCGV